MSYSRASSPGRCSPAPATRRACAVAAASTAGWRLSASPIAQPSPVAMARYWKRLPPRRLCFITGGQPAQLFQKVGVGIAGSRNHLRENARLCQAGSRVDLVDQQPPVPGVEEEVHPGHDRAAKCPVDARRKPVEMLHRWLIQLGRAGEAWVANPVLLLVGVEVTDRNALAGRRKDEPVISQDAHDELSMRYIFFDQGHAIPTERAAHRLVELVGVVHPGDADAGARASRLHEPGSAAQLPPHAVLGSLGAGGKLLRRHRHAASDRKPGIAENLFGVWLVEAERGRGTVTSDGAQSVGVQQPVCTAVLPPSPVTSQKSHAMAGKDL